MFQRIRRCESCFNSVTVYGHFFPTDLQGRIEPHELHINTSSLLILWGLGSTQWSLRSSVHQITSLAETVHHALRAYTQQLF